MATASKTDSPAPPEAGSTAPRSRWEPLIWPLWLPVRARVPLIAQIAGACALIAAIAMPRWPEVPKLPPVVQAAPTVRLASTVPPALVVPEPPPRPAHLNLDVRHSLQSVQLSIAVDGTQVLDTTLAGNRKRFAVVGKRAEKSYTKTLDLSPGVRVVRVRVRSADDKFDQVRVERFDLDSASVAGLKIAADDSGLSVVAERPWIERPPATPVAPAPLAQGVQAVHAAQQAEASALAELYKTLRSALIAMAGVVASAATGVFVQEYLKSRRRLLGVEP